MKGTPFFIMTEKTGEGRFLCSLVAGIITCWVWGATVFAADGASSHWSFQGTVVIANQSVPDSVELAYHYLEARGLPSNHVFMADLPSEETISRLMYEEKLRDPLLEFLRERGLIKQVQLKDDGEDNHHSGWRTVESSLYALVAMYGVPLRIEETRPYLLQKLDRILGDPLQRDGAAVDSELSCLLWEKQEISGVIPNPHYNMVLWPQGGSSSRPVVLAARLDGPDPETVRRMIDDTLRVEQEGLYGRAYVDARSVRDPGYILGDHWLNEAAVRLSRMGMDVVLDRSEVVFPGYYPMQDAAVYLGWYSEHVSGPFTSGSFRFRPGAVAYHLHSTSARSLRVPDRYWAGPLLSRGAAAVMGAVDEPYLSYTPDLQVFIDRLASGHPFGEAAYISQRVLSWQITVIGDPLYRPFAPVSADRIKDMVARKSPDLPWEQIRRMNLMADQHQFNPALAFGREALRQFGDQLIREKIADFYAKNNLLNDAVQEYRGVVEGAASDLTAIRVGHRMLLILRLLKREEEAIAIESFIRGGWPDSPFLEYLDQVAP